MTSPPYSLDYAMSNLIVLVIPKTHPHIIPVNLNCLEREYSEGFEYSLEKGNWSNELWENVPFGQPRRNLYAKLEKKQILVEPDTFGPREGIIGIYDGRNFGHIRSMLEIVQTFLR